MVLLETSQNNGGAFEWPVQPNLVGPNVIGSPDLGRVSPSVKLVNSLD